jgi:CelD/BcsL family acetyltransferase involved in cellulose biosynthesis
LVLKESRVQAIATTAATLNYRAVGRPLAAAAAPVVMPLTVGLHHDLQALRDEWIAFENVADCTVFQTFEWLAAYQLHVGERQGETPCVAVVRGANNAIVSIVPLAVRRTGLVSELTFLGSDLCDYNAPLLTPGFIKMVGRQAFVAVWRDILAQIQSNPLSHFDIVRLEKMPSAIGVQENPLVVYLTNTLNPSGSWATSLAGSWDAFYAAKRSSATRSRDRSKRKRLEDARAISFKTLDRASDVAQTLDVLMAQKAQAFSARGIRNIFQLPGYADFYRAIATDPRFSRIVHVSALDAGDEPVAVNLGLTFRNRYYYVLSSYTGGPLAKFGPGAIHLHELMRYAIARGMTDFDFTIGDERYKRDWCDGVQPLYDHVSTATLRGALAATGLRAMRRVKRAIKQNKTLWAFYTALRSRFAHRNENAAP